MMNLSSYYYKGRRDEQLALRLWIKELAAARVRYGCKRIYILLRREGWIVNHKRIRRLYKLDGLSLRYKKPKRHVSSVNRRLSLAVSTKDECWSMDFVADQLLNERKIRGLTIVDNFSHECLNITVDHSLKGEDVVEAMCYIYQQFKWKPKRIKVDNVANLSQWHMNIKWFWNSRGRESLQITYILNHLMAVLEMNV